MIFSLLGGIGLFLLGMILLTDGLKSFAGDSLRKALLRFTGRPALAFTSGALVTALVQSSSATTLATIGFVSAGLLGFSQSVGLVIGASLGTTSTGWLVAGLGLKFSITQFVLPLIGAGTFLRLLARGRLRSLGLAIAGFGLIFVGIDFLQLGMAGLTDHVDLHRIPSTGFGGHLLTLALGVFLTVVMQSSSAAVATILAALHAEAISFEQSASLVVGAAIGTTITAVIAAFGGSVAAKRTALAHVLFNLTTGLLAIILLPFFIHALAFAQARLGWQSEAIGLAAFHTTFIAVGVLIFLPITGPFSRLIERLLPEKSLSLTRHLDPSLLTLPAVAIEAARGSLRETAALLMEILLQRLHNGPPPDPSTVDTSPVRQALRETSEFIARIPPLEHQSVDLQLRNDSFHAIDHIAQLLPCAETSQRPVADPSLREAVSDCRQALAAAILHLRATDQRDTPGHAELESLSTNLAEWRRAARRRLLERSASGDAAAEVTLHLLDTIRWIDQITYHTWRVTHHLGRHG
jgi:phosphate:Na+ symporter